MRDGARSQFGSLRQAILLLIMFASFWYLSVSDVHAQEESTRGPSIDHDCAYPGNKATITWIAEPGVTKYALRINRLDTPWAGNCKSTQYEGDVCRDDITGTSFTHTVDPKKQYSYWVHTVLPDKSLSVATVRKQDILCAPNCANVTGPSTLVVGQKGQFAAVVTSNDSNLSGQLFVNNFAVTSPIQRFSGVDGVVKMGWTPTAPGTYQMNCRAWNDERAECRSSTVWSGPTSTNPAIQVCAGPTTSKTVIVVNPSPTPTPTKTPTPTPTPLPTKTPTPLPPTPTPMSFPAISVVRPSQGEVLNNTRKTGANNLYSVLSDYTNGWGFVAWVLGAAAENNNSSTDFYRYPEYLKPTILANGNLEIEAVKDFPDGGGGCWVYRKTANTQFATSPFRYTITADVSSNRGLNGRMSIAIEEDDHSNIYPGSYAPTSEVGTVRLTKVVDISLEEGGAQERFIGFKFCMWGTNSNKIKLGDKATLSFASLIKSPISASSLATTTAPLPSNTPTPTPTPIRYTISAVSNPQAGGTITKNPSTGIVSPGQSIVLTASPASGYRFLQWKEGTTVLGTTNPLTLSNIQTNRTIVAEFVLNTYAVSYNGNVNTGGVAPGNQTKIHGTPLTLATNTGALVKTGYTFSGWNTLANGTGTTYLAGGSYTANAPLTLFAKWTANTLTITTSASPQNGGTLSKAPTSGVVNYGGSLTLTATPSSGYRFVQWKEGTTVLGTTNPLTLSNIQTNRTIIAELALIPSNTPTPTPAAIHTFSGRVQYSGGTGVPGVVIKLYEYTLSPTVTRTYKRETTTGSTGTYSFTNLANGTYDVEPQPNTQISIAQGSEMQTIVVTQQMGDVTVPPFTVNPKNFTITTSSSPQTGGTITKNPSAGIVSPGQSIILTASPATGYRFVQWKEGTTVLSTSNPLTLSFIQANRTIIGEFVGQPYTITYNGNVNTGGVAPGNQTKIHGTPLTLATNTGALVKTGYTFSGWNTLANGTGTAYPAGASYTANAPLTLNAKWTANTLAVTYDTQGGNTISSGSTTTGGVIPSSPGTPTRAGHTFKGWFVAPTGGTAITFPYTHGKTTSFTLYAQWTQQAGSLKVTISGVVPTSAGWSIPGFPVSLSGQTLPIVPAGQYTITFQDVVGYDTPAPQQATIIGSQATIVTSATSYVRQLGTLAVTVASPPTGWALQVAPKRSGQTEAHESEWQDRVSPVSLGTNQYWVRLKTLTGYTVGQLVNSANQPVTFVTIVKNQAIALTGSYAAYTPTPAIVPSPTPTPITTVVPSNTPIPTATPLVNTPTPTDTCPRFMQGDANCDGEITLADYTCWKAQYQKVLLGQTVSPVGTCRIANFSNADVATRTKVVLLDFAVWRVNYLR